MPAVTALPLDAVGSMIGDLVSGMGAQTLQYGSGQGDPRLRERICDVMALEGITDAAASEVVVTVGSQQALDLVTRVFCDPGDVILAEAPSYVGALGVFQAAEARVRHVLLVIEDNPYGLLGFDHEPLPTLRSRNSQRVIYLGSFSKTFSPGLRV